MIIGQGLSNIKYSGIGREFQDGMRKEIVNNVRFMNSSDPCYEIGSLAGLT